MNNTIFHSTVYFRKNQPIEPGMIFTYQGSNFFVVAHIEEKFIKLLSSHGQMYDVTFDKFSTALSSIHNTWRIVPQIQFIVIPVFIPLEVQ